jgi:4-hydroxy-3-methylbut-2-enyl diphosphate reductase
MVGALDHFWRSCLRAQGDAQLARRQELADRGACPSTELDVPVGAGGAVYFTVSCRGIREQRSRGLQVLDATCPLVTKVHVEAKRFAADLATIVLIGRGWVEEVVCTMGEAPDAIRLIGTVGERSRS